MKKEIKQISEDGKFVQITVADSERWYTEELDDGTIESFPSASWIVQFVPKGVAYMKWLASIGYDESKAIMETRGAYGHKTHQLIADYLKGQTIKFDGTVENHDTGEQDEIKLEEYQALKSFMDFDTAIGHPKTLVSEEAFINRVNVYAGTVDWVCEVKEDVKIPYQGIVPKGRGLIDFKISNNVFLSHKTQAAAYAHFFPEKYIDWVAILQVGYQSNKLGYKFNILKKDNFDTFKSAYKFWEEENGKKSPAVVDLPMEIKRGVAHFRPDKNPLAPKAKPKKR